MHKKKILNTAGLLILVAILSLITTYFVVKEGKTNGLLLIPIIIGISLLIVSSLVPKIGYFLAIIISFFISDIERIVHVESLTYVVDIFIIATFGGMLLQKMITREKFWKYCNHPIIYAYLVYVLYTVLQIFNPNVESLNGTLLMVRKFFTLLLFYYCTLQLMHNLRDIQKYLKIWFALSFLTAFYGCLQAWFGIPQYQLDFIFSNELLVGLYRLDDGDFRKFSFLADPKAYGLLLAATVLIPIVFFVNNKYPKLKKAELLIFILVLIMGMSYSGTRTANFMLLIGLLLFVLMTLSRVKSLIFLCILGLIFVFIIYAPIYGNVTINRIRSTFDLKSEASMQVRDENRKRIQPYILSHPIGGGLGSTGVLNIKNNLNHPLRGFPTDSGFLQVALEIGWLGLLIQCTVYFIILQSGIKAYYSLRKPLLKNLVLASTIGIFSYVAAQYSQVAIGAAPGIFLFYGLIGIIIRIPQIEKEEKTRINSN